MRGIVAVSKRGKSKPKNKLLPRNSSDEFFGKGSSVVLFSSSEIVSLRASWCPLKDCRPFQSEGPDFPLS